MNEYMKYLIIQYKKARGYKQINIKSSEFKNDFKKWLKKNEVNGINYLSLLYALGIDVTHNNTAEVNKGSLDSIVLPYETTIITPYDRCLEKRDNVIKSEFDIIHCHPAYNNVNPNIYRFMIQNPYFDFNNYIMRNWEDLHDSSKYEVVFGVYGNIYDEDKEDKLKMLEMYKKHLNKDYIEEYDIFNNSYSYVIASKPKIKTKKSI